MSQFDKISEVLGVPADELRDFLKKQTEWIIPDLRFSAEQYKEFFYTNAIWKEIEEVLKKELKLHESKLKDPTNSRDIDLVIKGEILVVESILQWPEKCIQQATH